MSNDMSEKCVLTETTWEVTLPRDENGLTGSAEFDTEENARAAWADNQPSLLVKTVTETFMRGEVLAQWLALTDQDRAQRRATITSGTNFQNGRP